MSLLRAGALACLPTCPIAHLPQLGTVPLPPALESCVGLFAADRPHAAPALAEGSREGRGLRVMVPQCPSSSPASTSAQQARPARSCQLHRSSSVLVGRLFGPRRLMRLKRVSGVNKFRRFRRQLGPAVTMTAGFLLLRVVAAHQSSRSSGCSQAAAPCIPVHIRRVRLVRVVVPNRVPFVRTPRSY